MVESKHEVKTQGLWFKVSTLGRTRLDNGTVDAVDIHSSRHSRFWLDGRVGPVEENSTGEKSAACFGTVTQQRHSACWAAVRFVHLNGRSEVYRW